MGRWLPPAYLFYNVLFMVTLMWAVHSRESVDAIHTVSYFRNIFVNKILIGFLKAAAINFSSFFFDLVIIISFFPDFGGIWSTVFAVVNLAARPFSLLLLHKELVDRGGDFVLVSVIPSNPNNARTPRNYQDIDGGAARGVPNSQSGQSNISNLF